MNSSVKQNKTLLVSIVMVFLLLYQDSISLNIGFLSITQVMVFSFLFVLLSIYIKNRKGIKLDVFLIFGYLILCAISLFINKSNAPILSYLYLGLEIFTFKTYIDLFDTKEDFFNSFIKVLYVTAIILSLFGIIQIIGYNLKINFLYNFSYLGFENNYDRYLPYSRITSLYSEPAHLCMILGSGFFVSLYYIMTKNNKKSIYALILITIVSILSYSVITYVCVLLYCILFMIYYFIFLKKSNTAKMRKYIINILLIILIPVIVLYVGFINTDSNTGLGEIKYKIDNFRNSISYSNKQNLTTYAITSNFNIALQKYREGKLLGTGLFTHNLTYDYYMEKIFQKKYRVINSTDAASIFIRIFSELGIIGLVVFVCFIVKKIYIGFKKKNIIILFMVLLLIEQGARLGNYTFPLFVISLVFLITYRIGGEKNEE